MLDQYWTFQSTQILLLIFQPLFCFQYVLIEIQYTLHYRLKTMDVPDIDLADVRNILNKTKSLLDAREAQAENSFGFFVEGILLVGRKY